MIEKALFALQALAALGAILGLVVDLWSLFLWIRLIRDGNGKSGTPIVGLVLYAVFAASRKDFRILLALGFVHALCHWILPRGYRLIAGGDSDGE